MNDLPAQKRWYSGVTPYQWLVLAIASAGWVFDVYQGQIFNITRHQLLSDILKGGGTDAAIKNYGDVFLAIFLVGGAVGVQQAGPQLGKVAGHQALAAGNAAQ